MTKMLRILATLGILTMAVGAAVFTPTVPILAASATYYPNAHPESTSVDGFVQHGIGAPGGTFADLINDVGGTHSAGPSTTFAQSAKLASGGVLDQWVELYRNFFLFDTSGLPDDALVTAATIRIFTYNKIDTLSASPTWAIYSSTPASNTDLVAGDFPNVGSTELSGVVTWASIAESSYTTFTLNAAGIAAITPTGVSKFSMRNANYEVAGSAPTWGSGQEFSFAIVYADYGSTKPELNVTYTVPPTVTTTANPLATQLGASLPGNITNTGGTNPTIRGFGWDTDSGAPYANSINESGSYSTGAYSLEIDGLSANTTYYYRAFATNAAGTGYGAEQSFTTPLEGELGQSSASQAGNPIQRQAFYAEGLYWFFYPFGTSSLTLSYSTSLDRDNWEYPTSLGVTVYNAWDFSIWYDGTDVYYARKPQIGNTLYFRKGEPQSDGTITWAAAEQTVVANAEQDLTDWLQLSTITVDSTGHAYIAYRDTDEDLQVIRNSNVDGTWATTAGFPYELAAVDESTAILLPLGTGIYAIYKTSISGKYQGITYDGSWGGAENATTALGYYWWIYSAVEDSGVIELVFVETTTYTLMAATRSVGGVWTEVDIADTVLQTSTVACPSLTKLPNNDLAVFYGFQDVPSDAAYTIDHVYYQLRVDGVWADPVDWLDESADGYYDVDWTSSMYEGSAGFATFLAYTTGAGPYTVKMAGLVVSGVTTDAATSVTSSSMQLNGTLTVVIGDNITARGFAWGWFSGAYVESYTDNGSFGVGAFSTNLTGLWPGEAIYYRAFAVNSSGTTYGGEETSGTTTPPTTITDAMYHGKIYVHNDNVTSAKTGVSTNMTFDASGWITNGFLDSDFSNTSVRNGNNTDIPYMPPRTGTTSFIIHVDPSIAANTIQSYFLDTGGPSDMGGDLAYFPDTSGATIVDAASLELSDTFVLDFYHWYVNASVSDNMCAKPSAILVSTASGNVTAAVTGGPTITAAVTDGQHDIQVAGYDGQLLLYVDGVLSDNDTLAAGVPNTADNWTFARGGNTQYLYRFRIRVDGASGGMWDWENGATFTDSSGNGNTATPTFRTNSTDADVWAELVDFTPAALAEADTAGMGGGNENIVDTPTQPTGMYTELNVSVPGAAMIDAILDGASIPRAIFWFPTFMLFIMLISFATHWGTRSVVMKAVVLWLCFMFVAALGGWGWWILIPFAVELTAAVVAMKKASW